MCSDIEYSFSNINITPNIFVLGRHNLSIKVAILHHLIYVHRKCLKIRRNKYNSQFYSGLHIWIFSNVFTGVAVALFPLTHTTPRCFLCIPELLAKTVSTLNSRPATCFWTKSFLWSPSDQVSNRSNSSFLINQNRSTLHSNPHHTTPLNPV